MRIDVIEPATEAVISSLLGARPSDVDEAVEYARAAQRAWWRRAPAERAELLLRIADGIEHEAERLAQMEARNVGMPISDARGAIAAAAATFRLYAGAPQRLGGTTIPVAGGVDMTFREPLGVVGVITPWNFPLTIASWKIAPALAAGNAVIHKPSELTPLTALELRRIVEEAGAPESLLTVLVGTGEDVGRRIVEHPGIAKVAFTGSTAAGREIAAAAARDVKRVTLELGGTSPSIVFADADLDAAARGLAGAVFGNAGQDCCARTRVFVQRAALPAFMERLEETVRGLRVGDPLDAGTQMGPLISARQLERVSGYVDGAPVALQGSAPAGRGFWFPPTVLHPIGDDHPAAREEIVGPVVCVAAFDDEAEAIKRANDTVYGHSGSIWTADGARAMRVARALDIRALAINAYTSVRVGTAEAYTELKNVFMAT